MTFVSKKDLIDKLRPLVEQLARLQSDLEDLSDEFDRAIDYFETFGPTDHEAWEAEYCANVRALDWLNSAPTDENRPSSGELRGAVLPYDFLEEFEHLEPAQRQILLDELADRPELWSGEEVMMI